MDSVQILIVLMFAAAILVGFAQRIHVPYPIALVVGGGAIGFIPGLPSANFDPGLLLTIVLPPILYYAAVGISFREFKKNWRTIFSLALGLVVATTFVIAILFKWLFPQFSWALAFAFGAIIAPPDAIAATTILKRFGIGSRLLTILEGESLINDASAIVLYRLAAIAIYSGTFSFAQGGMEFIKIASGGIFVGFVLGVVIQWFSRNYLEPVVGVVFSFTVPYITYVAADLLGVSGILAVVVNGLIAAQVLLRHRSSLRRILGFAAWDIMIILLNCFVFILIGLQLGSITRTMTIQQMILYSSYALLFSVALILVRMVWVYAKSAFAYVKALYSPDSSRLCPKILKEATLVAWSGMRGIVSLAIVLTLPYYLSNGEPLDGRSEVIFITFVVILITLLVPGLTLEPLIRWLNIHPRSEHHGALRIRKQLAKFTMEHIRRLHLSNQINDDEFNFLNEYFNLQHQVLEISHSRRKTLQHLESIRLQIIQEQRKELVNMWERMEVDDKLLVHLEHELDVEEIRMARAELK